MTDKGIEKVIEELFDKYSLAFHNLAQLPNLPRRKERSKAITSLIEGKVDE